MTKLDELMQAADGLPDADIETLVSLARGLRVTMAPAGGLPDWLVNAPLDDEPLTAGDLAAIAEAESEYTAGRTTSSAEAKRRLLA